MFDFLKRKVELKVPRWVFYLAIVPGFALLAVLVVWSIHSIGSKKPGSVETTTPAETVKDFYQFLKSGNLGNARALITLQFVSARVGNPEEVDKVVVNTLVQEEKIAQKYSVKILEEQITGDFAILKVEYSLPAQKTKTQRYVYLYHEHNFWYIAGLGASPPWPTAPARPSTRR